MTCDDVTYHEGLFVAVTGLDGAGVEEPYLQQELRPGRVREQDVVGLPQHGKCSFLEIIKWSQSPNNVRFLARII